MTARSDEAPLSMKAYRFYSDRIFPNVEDVRGTTRLNNLLREISLKSILSDTVQGFRLDTVKQKPVFKEKLDSKYVFMETDYLEHLLQATKEANVFCDIGGYHGFYSLVSNSDNSIVFEADPSNAEHIKENIGLNPSRDIKLVEKAVWSSNGSVEFEAEGSGTSHVSENGIEREAVTLESFFEDREDPDVVKIDVEGAEGNVIEGAEKVLDRSHPTLFIEFHNDGRIQNLDGSEEEIRDLLRELDYCRKWRSRRNGEVHEIWEIKTARYFRDRGQYA